MRTLLSLRKLIPALIVWTGALSLLIAAIDPVPVNALCPVTKKAADSSRTVPYSKEVKFCCEECRKQFNQNPDAEVNAVADFKAESTKCLMCDKPADKEIRQIYMRVVALSDDSCLPLFKASPDKYIVFAVTHPRAVNQVCPMSGGKVDSKCTVPYQKEVLFCCQECHDSFNKAQDANVEKVAKFDRTKEKCLLCENKSDPDHKEIYRRTIGCSTQAHVEAFKAAADEKIAKAVQDKN